MGSASQFPYQLSQEFLQTVFLHAGDGIFLVEDQKIIEANPRGCEMFGYAYEEIIGLPLMEQIPADEIEHILQKLALLAQTKFVMSESAFYRKDGSRMAVEISGTMLSNGQILGIMRDITERKKAENELRASQERFRQLMVSAPDAVFSMDQDGFILFANDEATRLLGYTLDELMNMNVDQLVPLATRDAHAEKRMAYAQKPHTRFMGSGLQINALHKDGHEIEMDIKLSHSKTEEGLLVIAFMRDISEQKEAEKKLHEAQLKILENERLMASLKERERLARQLHDSLGQTFGYINIQAETIRELSKRGEAEITQPLLARLSEVAQESHRDLRTYIQELKNSSDVLHQDFFSALERYCHHYEQSYLFKIHLNLPARLPEVLASAQVETHLIYIIREAVGNARRYSQKSEASITISVDDEFVNAIIEDEGIGIVKPNNEPEHRKKAHFGLRIMRERANEVGGTVTVESQPGQGTRVMVKLPRNLFQGGLHIARVMIVDDHPLFVDGLRNMLVARGVHVIGVAKDGQEACEMAPVVKPDLILMDINMPRMNGLEAVRCIRATMPAVKIVMLTTSTAKEDVLDALSVGASGYLPKGTSAHEFLVRLSEIMHGNAEFSAELAKQMLAVFATKNHKTAELTERQVEILRLIAKGLTYREIGERLYLTERTVKYHMGEILERLHLKGRQEAEEYARRQGVG
jgi:PAS domain S-box-containing protein